MMGIRPSDRCVELITYFFGEASSDDCSLEALQARTKFWFFRDAAVDAHIREQFADDVASASAGERAGWSESAYGRLGLVLLLDQFPRHLHRGSGQAFATDAVALDIAREGIARNVDAELSSGERLVFYLPLMHAEDASVQASSCSLYRRLAENAPTTLRPELENAHLFAERHREIVERFGRFPHRNEPLGRQSTPEEIAFLQEPNSAF